MAAVLMVAQLTQRSVHICHVARKEEVSAPEALVPLCWPSNTRRSGSPWGSRGSEEPELDPQLVRPLTFQEGMLAAGLVGQGIGRGLLAFPFSPPRSC